MAALVPYGGTTLATLPISYARNLNRAYTAGKFLWKHRGTIKAGYSAMRGYVRKRRSYRKRYSAIAKARRAKRRKLNGIGKRPGSSSCKRIVVRNDEVIKNGRDLFFSNLVEIPKQTSLDELNYRARDIANVRGAKICWTFQNLLVEPLFLNFAIIVQRNPNVSNDLTQEFFRGATANKRGIDFGTGLNGNEMHCLPINTDRFIVLMHKRWTLAPKDQATNNAFWKGSACSYFSFQHYFRLKRQMAFDETVTTAEGRTPKIVWWCCPFTAVQSQPVTPTCLSVQRRIVTYFRDPKN